MEPSLKLNIGQSVKIIRGLWKGFLAIAALTAKRQAVYMTQLLWFEEKQIGLKRNVVFWKNGKNVNGI